MGKKIFWPLLLLLACLVAGRAWAGGHPAWWAEAKAQAEADGYGLLSATELQAILKKGGGKPGKALLLDVRPSYEYAAGHIGGAANLEFHLGHRLKLETATRDALQRLAGPDPDRPIIIYCRSFR